MRKALGHKRGLMQDDTAEPEISLRAQRRRWRQDRYRTLMELFATASPEQEEAMIDLFVEEQLGRKRN
jgi:hypothetical protein